MKRSILSLLAALALAGTASAYEQPKVYDLKPNERVLIIGDSTTYDGTDVAGYVRLVDQAIQEQIPDRKAAVRSQAWPGVKLVPEHPERWKPMAENESWRKVLQHPNAPTTVIYNLGLNDSKQGEANVPTYEKWVRKYVEDVRANKMNVILCTPTLWVGLTQTKSYAEAVRRVATEMKCPLIDLYAAHAAAFEQKKRLTRDGTHLNMAGEIMSASTILNAFGLKAEWKRYQLRFGAMRNNWSTGGDTKVLVEPALSDAKPDLENPKGPFPIFGALWNANWPTEQAAYAPGTKVTLKVDPASGRIFHHWADFDGLLPKDAPATLTIVMDGHKSVTLYYEAPADGKRK